MNNTAEILARLVRMEAEVARLTAALSDFVRAKERAYTVAEAAAWLRVSSRTVLNLIERGELCAKAVVGGSGKRYRISQSCLNAYMESGNPPAQKKEPPKEGGSKRLIKVKQLLF